MAAGSSKPSSFDASARPHPELEYLYALNANVSNIVSVKLSGDSNYHIWERQMSCLLKSYNVHGLVYGQDPEALSPDLKTRFDSLVKGWIFGSISEGLLDTVVDLESAKDVWDKLKSFYGPTTSDQKDTDKLVPIKRTTVEPHTVSAERYPEDQFVVPTENGAKDTAYHVFPIEPDEYKYEYTIRDFHKDIRKKLLHKAIVEGNWDEVESTIRDDKDAIEDKINSDDNTVLHIAVGLGHNYLVKVILQVLKENKLPEMVNLDGSTALHIAAIVGNTDAAELLVNRDKTLLGKQDKKGQTPLEKAFENMHLETIEYLLIADGETKESSSSSSSVSPVSGAGLKIGVNLLVNAVSGKQYDLATNLLKKHPEFAVENDNVLMEMARTFPSGPKYGETFIYPSMTDNFEGIVQRTKKLYYIFVHWYRLLKDIKWHIERHMELSIGKIIKIVSLPVLFWILNLILLLISMAYFPFSMFYFFLWKVSSTKVAPIKHMEKKKKEWEDAKEVLKLICDQIDKLRLRDPLYTRPVLEAARQDAYEVVDEILTRFPGAIRYKDKNGYDIIQLAVIHRSEKIYNLINVIWERKSVYRMVEDSSKNNMLHLAGRLAPSHKLKLSIGAALQLQRELQWREEVKKLVSPAYITKQNMFMETPDMIFTKEHQNLVKEGEQWMKTVAESCSITASLITTIVFAAAITVPGGTNENTGIPLFRDEIAFTIFAVSDAVSLFASSTALLMFLSILTGRFSEQDFLVRLPRRLIFGLCTLMISTTAMMVAFGATLFLVFCHKKPWMLAPICVLALVPIASFSSLQIPLIVDLVRSTCLRIFANKSDKISHRFNTDDIRLYFGK